MAIVFPENKFEVGHSTAYRKETEKAQIVISGKYD